MKQMLIAYTHKNPKNNTTYFNVANKNSFNNPKGVWTVEENVHSLTGKDISPSLIEFKEKLYLFYVWSGDKTINFLTSEGFKWSPYSKLKDTKTDTSPSPVIVSDMLFVFYRNADDSHISYIATLDGKDWSFSGQIMSAEGSVFPETDKAPSAVVFQDDIYVFYKDANSTSISYVSRLHSNEIWRVPKTIQNDRSQKISTNYEPSAAVVDDKIFVSWAQHDENNRGVFYSSSTDGKDWSGFSLLNVPYLENPCFTSAVKVEQGGISELNLFIKDNQDSLFEAELLGSDWTIKQVSNWKQTALKSSTKIGVCQTSLVRVGLDKWMAAISPDLLLSEITIPGTHDTCTYTASSLLPNKCQNLTLEEQLNAGIRFIDIRLQPHDHKLRVQHSTISMDIDFSSVIDNCRNFLEINSTETIIMLVNQASGESEEFAGLFSKYTVNDDLWHFGSTIPTLNEVRRKIVLLRRFPDHEDRGIDLTGWQSKDKHRFKTPKDDVFCIQDDYHHQINPIAIGHKIKEIKDLIDDADKDESNSWYINFTNASGAANPNAYADRINPKWGEDSVYIPLKSYKNRLGTIVMDFPNDYGPPDTITKIINVNFNVT